MILLIEDEPGIADSISYALKTDGMDSHCAPTGNEGIDFLQENDVELIILDVGLPDGSGFDFCRQIRKQFDLPIIFLTARSDEIDRVVGLELGADDYVVKPFSPRELVARVKAVLRRSQKKRTIIIQEEQILDFIINRERISISYKNQCLNLSRYEFRILELLLSKPGRVYSREQLMEHVWEEPEMSLIRTVDTHIKTIRAKLKKIDPGSDAIETHRGFGYSLRGDY